ncbi:hypothetical protein BgiBS90_024148 [Biomphalaria glabrata]|nr:hypothetical protein BgiBS90_024148 [Biomphalaria glabrata]
MREEMKMMVNMIGNKVDELVSKKEGQIDPSDKIMSQSKEGIDLLTKEQLPGQDCGCTNSGDGGAGDCSAVCDCVVGKSCEGDFQDEKLEDDCCDDLSWMYRIETKETNESDLNGGELIPAKPDAMVDEHYKEASWAHLTDEAEKDYVLETMASCGPTTVSRHVHGKGPLTWRL